jgi:hypothetical protein
MDETERCFAIRCCPAVTLNLVNARDDEPRVVFYGRMRLACVSIGPLNRDLRTAFLFISLLLGAGTVSDGHPYSAIVVRNVFGLKEPRPPEVIKPTAPPRPVPTLVLTGVADFSTTKWAFITRTDPGARPRYYTLTLGETEGGLQLLDIDAKSATVKLRVDGLETVALDLASPTNQVVKPPLPAQLSGVRGISFPRVR